jgi:hypothetical protein
MRSNPGPFEPLIYLLQTPTIFRVVGIGGLAMFSILAFSISAADSGLGAVVLGLILLGALWYEASASICRRCRFYGTWHCAGQGMLVSRMFPRIEGGVSEPGVMLHGALAAAYLAWAMVWLWHSPMLGMLYTLWLPVAFISTTTPQGYSWRARKAEQN